MWPLNHCYSFAVCRLITAMLLHTWNDIRSSALLEIVCDHSCFSLLGRTHFGLKVHPRKEFHGAQGETRWKARRTRVPRCWGARPPSCFVVPWSSWPSFWLVPGLLGAPSCEVLSWRYAVLVCGPSNFSMAHVHARVLFASLVMLGCSGACVLQRLCRRQGPFSADS